MPNIFITDLKSARDLVAQGKHSSNAVAEFMVHLADTDGKNGTTDKELNAYYMSINTNTSNSSIGIDNKEQEIARA